MCPGQRSGLAVNIVFVLTNHPSACGPGPVPLSQDLVLLCMPVGLFATEYSTPENITHPLPFYSGETTAEDSSTQKKLQSFHTPICFVLLLCCQFVMAQVRLTQ